jgi:peptidoglycan-N-acetylglucosamine deacetylase
VRGVAAAGAAAAGAAAVWFRPPFALVRRVARAMPDVLFCVETEAPLVALSFDDGPHPATTPLVLDALARHGARATFFCVGERAAAHPGLVRRIAAGGHELGNHTWRVERSASLAPAALAESVDRTQEVLAAVAPVRLMRPGSGWVTASVRAAAARHDLRCVLGSVYPHDPLFASRRYIAQFVRARARPGAILILHEGTPARADRRGARRRPPRPARPRAAGRHRLRAARGADCASQ